MLGGGLSNYRLANMVMSGGFFVTLVVISVMRGQTVEPPAVYKFHNGTVVFVCHRHHHSWHRNSTQHHRHHHRHRHANGTGHHRHGNGSTVPEELERHRERRSHGFRSHDLANHHRDRKMHVYDTETDLPALRYRFDAWLYSSIAFILLSLLLQVAVAVDDRYVLFRQTALIELGKARVLKWIYVTCGVLDFLSVLLVITGLALHDADHWPRHPCGAGVPYGKLARHMNAATLGMTWCLSCQFALYCLTAYFVNYYLAED